MARCNWHGPPRSADVAVAPSLSYGLGIVRDGGLAQSRSVPAKLADLWRRLIADNLDG